MSTFFLALAIVTVTALLAVIVFIALGVRTIDFLSESEPAAAPQPRVSVIVSALNEERNIEEALGSWLAQDYPNLELIVINDRSTDRTGEILERMARANPILKAVHIKELPEGWLGKNHALDCGAAQSSGEILLFSDADVVMHPSAIGRAVGYIQRRGLDHLTISPQTTVESLMTRILIGIFGIFFVLYAVPWAARHPRLPWFVGIGAFNMIRRQAYLAFGGHRALAMCPLDDMMLGKLVKKNGFRQDFLFGRGMIYVEWYASVREIIRGLTKNAFAGTNYSVVAILGATVFQFTFFIWPFLGIFVTGGWARLLNGLAAALILMLCHGAAPFHDDKPRKLWHLLLYPLATPVFIYILWRSMIVTLLRRGIVWRGTHYPLDKLKGYRI